jgi:hypothetical protein
MGVPAPPPPPSSSSSSSSSGEGVVFGLCQVTLVASCPGVVPLLLGHERSIWILASRP